MTTPDEDPTGERPRPDVHRRERAVAESPNGPATLPGLVVTEERLPDGRRITFFGTTR